MFSGTEWSDHSLALYCKMLFHHSHVCTFIAQPSLEIKIKYKKLWLKARGEEPAFAEASGLLSLQTELFNSCNNSVIVWQRRALCCCYYWCTTCCCVCCKCTVQRWQRGDHSFQYNMSWQHMKLRLTFKIMSTRNQRSSVNFIILSLFSTKVDQVDKQTRQQFHCRSIQQRLM